MRLVPNRLSLLIAHGLHESEARVYLALLEQSTMTASALARDTQVPRSHLYKVLHDLHVHGLVDILLAGSSRAYRARPFHEFLDLKANELRVRLSEIEAQKTTLGVVMRPPEVGDDDGELGEVRAVFDRKAVAREVDALLESARTEVVIAASSGGADRVARHLSPHWAAWKRAEVAPRVVVALPDDATTSVDWADLPGGGSGEVRRIDGPRRTMVFIADRTRAIFVRPIPDTSDAVAGNDFGIFTADPAFAQDHVALLLAASDRETSARRGEPPDGPAGTEET